MLYVFLTVLESFYSESNKIVMGEKLNETLMTVLQMAFRGATINVISTELSQMLLSWGNQ